MPSRDGGERVDAIEQVIAEVGLANIETVLGSYRRFVEKVDYRKLVDWSVKQPLDDLLQPLFLAALVTISRELELGDVGRLLVQMESGEWEWAVRVDGPYGSRIRTVSDEADAREDAAAAPSVNGYTYTPMRRRIGPWVEVPTGVESSPGSLNETGSSVASGDADA